MLASDINTDKKPKPTNVEKVPAEPCSVQYVCQTMACANCAKIKEGLWACTSCVDALSEVVDILPFYADIPCHFCGAYPLLVLRVKEKKE